MKITRRTLTIAGSSTMVAGLIVAGVVLAPAGQAATPAAAASVTSSSAPSSTAAAPAPADHPARSGGRSGRHDARLRALEGNSCTVLKPLSKRADAAIKRLDGPATERGSLAWVKAEAAAATKAGKTDRAKKLTNLATKMTTNRAKNTKVATDLATLVKTDCG